MRTDRRTEIVKLIVVSAPSRTPGQSTTAHRARAHARTHTQHYLDSTDICVLRRFLDGH